MHLDVMPTALSFRFLPVAVVVVFVITSQSSEAAETNGIGEENLSSSIHPHLGTKRKQYS